MKDFDPLFLQKLYKPSPDSHKGQNGKLLLIGGSKLFHAASLWSLQIASRIVDMVFYASVPENNEIVQKAKEEFRNGIVIKRDQIDNYIKEADCILIGPGLPRRQGQEEGDDDTKDLTEKLLKKHPEKKWVIDGGSLQTIDTDALLGLKQIPILTPHEKEFEMLFKTVIAIPIKSGEAISNGIAKSPRQGGTPRSDIKEKIVSEMAKKYRCVILTKGQTDMVCSPQECLEIAGGNSGMTKGGTGDVLAGLTAALYTKNEAFISAAASSYINKKAGESLFEKVGYYFNASDLADEIPHVMKKLILDDLTR